MSEELDPVFTSSFILSNVAQVLKLAFDDVEEAITTLVNDHVGLVCAPGTAVAVTPSGKTAKQSTNSAIYHGTRPNCGRNCGSSEIQCQNL